MFKNTLRRQSGYFLVVLFAGLTLIGIVSSCSDLPSEPGAPGYSLELNIKFLSSTVDLDWTPTPVSSFREYVVIRSTEPIPDTPEPEAAGNAIVIARIDERNMAEFVDAQYPLGVELFYKVYADIGERFLVSPTVDITPEFTFIPFRADYYAIDKQERRLVGFDISLGTLFEYDFASKEVVKSNTVGGQCTNLRLGNYQGTDEVYISDNNWQIRVFNRSNLSLRTSISTGLGTPVDFQYDKGKFFFTFRNTTPPFAVYSRNGQLLYTSNQATQYEHKLVLDTSLPDETIAFDVGLPVVTRYRIGSSGTLLGVESRAMNSSGNQAIPELKPGGDEMVLTNQGNISTTDLEQLTVLDSDNAFFTDITYSGDGTLIAGFFSIFQINSTKFLIRVFDTETYTEVQTTQIPFQANGIFSLDQEFYSTGIVFLNNQIGTIVLKSIE